LIALLRGVLAHVEQDWVIVETGGVGFRVQVPVSTRSRLPGAGAEVLLHTHLHVREDALVLYGFATREELETFDLLLTVTGVGPKVAVGVLSGITPGDFLRAVAFQDEEVLKGLPGVGKKTAQRIILDLKDKVGSFIEKTRPPEVIEPRAADSRAEAMEALVALGYGRLEAGQAVERAARQSAGSRPEELVRLALRLVARAKEA
jgi:Holliday junction DNA helicase RuvA